MGKAGIVAAVATLAAAASTAFAHEVEYSITAKFEVVEGRSETKFKGKVSSEKDACVRERKVKVFREEPKKSDSRIGTVFTKRSGKWILEPGEVVEDGDYYAKIPKKELSPDHVCLGTQTEALSVGS